MALIQHSPMLSSLLEVCKHRMVLLWEQPNHGDGHKRQVPVVIWPRFFISMSAGFWAPSIKKSSMILLLTNSQWLCDLISMCLLWASVIGLDVIKMEPWLSPHTGIGWRLYPSSPSSCHNHLACLLQSDREMYSASIAEWAMCSCLWECQLKVQLASLKNQPVWEWQSLWSDIQSESVYVIKPA